MVAKKWTRVRWEINKALLLDELPPEALAYLKESCSPRTSSIRRLRAGHLPPRLYDRAVKREDEGWNVSLKVLAVPAVAVDWELEEDLRE